MDTIGGLQLIRLLGSGARADVHLARSTVPVGRDARESWSADPTLTPNDPLGPDRGLTPARPHGSVSAATAVSVFDGTTTTDPSSVGGGDAATAAPVAVKVFRRSTPLASIDAEIDALARASSPHLLSLLDLTTDARGLPALVLARVGPHCLARLLADRRELSAGEAVTVLAPLIEAVDELHRVGVVHGRLRAGNVLFDDRGACVLVGFGHTRIVGAMPLEQTERSLTPAEADACEPMRSELAELHALVRTVIEATPPTPARNALLDAMLDGHGSGGSTEELLDRLFAFARPEPIARYADPVATGRPTRTPIADPVDDSAPLGSLAAWIDRLPLTLPEWLLEFVDRRRVPGPPVSDRTRRGLDDARSPEARHTGHSPSEFVPGHASTELHSGPSYRSESRVDGLRRSARRFLAPVRRSVWIAAACAAALVGAGLVGVAALEARSADAAGGGNAPGGSTSDVSAGPGPTDPSALRSAATAEDDAGTDSGADVDRATDAEADGDSTAASSAEESDTGTFSISAAHRAALAGDDPIAATLALLRARSACLASVSEACLTAIDQPDSAAMDADLATIGDRTGSRVDDPVPAPGPDPPTLVGRWGDSALVDVASSAPRDPSSTSEPDEAPTASVTVSILLVTGEDGWRIRDLTVG